MNIQNLHNVRENNKIGLEMFNLNKENKFDNAIEKLIVDLQKTIKDRQDSFDSINEMEPVKYAELAEEAERYEIDLESQQYDTITDIYYYQEELQSIIEMKIINAFRIVETDVKILIAVSFHYKNESNLYRWDNITNYLQTNSIDVKKFKSYTDILHLKQVNNAIKHKARYEMGLSNIPEFNSGDKFLSDKLLAFYNRIKKAPALFIDELAVAIYDELYKFNDEKIVNIAQSFVLRMSKEDAYKLANKIISYY